MVLMILDPIMQNAVIMLLLKYTLFGDCCLNIGIGRALTFFVVVFLLVTLAAQVIVAVSLI